MNNRVLSPNQLQILREKAVIEEHLKQKEACKVFGFSPTLMTRYMVENIEQLSMKVSFTRESR